MTLGEAADAQEAYALSMESRASRAARDQAKRGRFSVSHNRRRMRCGPTTRRCQEARKLEVETPECCKFWIRQLVEHVGGLLTATGIRWWIDYGTLLGYVREGGLISFDKDADFGVLAEDREALKALMPGLIRIGYWPRFTSPNTEKRFRSGDRMKVRLSVRNHTNVDIFCWHRRPEGMLDRLNYIAADIYKGRDFPESLVLPTTMGEWDGIPVAVPAQPEALVEWRYGPDWKTPLQAKHPPRPVGTWAEEHP